jgi:hypothetical protein
MKASTKKRSNNHKLVRGGMGNSQTSYGTNPKGQDPKESFEQFLKRIFPGEPHIPEGVPVDKHVHTDNKTPLFTYVPPEISVKEYHRLLREEPSLKQPRIRGGKSRKKPRKSRI